MAMPKAHCLMRTGLAPIRRSAGSSCATALMARPVKVLRQIQRQRHGQDERDAEGHQHAHRDADSRRRRGSCRCRAPPPMRWSTPKREDQPDLDDEARRRRRRRCRAPPPRCRASRRSRSRSGRRSMPRTKNGGISTSRRRSGRARSWLSSVGAVGAEHHDRRVRDVRHVEQAERHRQPDADRGVEAAEQDAEQHRLEQQVERSMRSRPEKTAR